MTLHPPPFWATLLTCCALAVLICLGCWQLKRAAWKDALIAESAQAWQSEPRAIDSYDLSLIERDQSGKTIHERVTLSGYFAPQQSVIVGPRTHEGKNGYHVITPFYMIDGAIVLVNRGWVETAPTFMDDPAQHARSVSGVLRRAEERGRFVPPNDLENDTWYHIDIDEIALVKYISTPSRLLLYASEDPVTIPHPRPVFKDNHRQYAFFWFSMALVLLVIFTLRFVIARTPE